MKSQDFINGLLVGAFAGLTVGLLFAPDKGSETRRMLAEKGNDLADAIKNKFGEYADDAEDIADKAKKWAKKGGQKAKDLMDDGKNMADQFEDKASDAFTS